MILFDRVINVSLRSSQDSTKRFDIITPSRGVKPDISVNFNMLDVGVAYQIQVEVTNMCQDRSFNIYDWDLMDVEIGYLVKDSVNDLKVHTMRCAIFNSYVASPNPDGKTVFVGIVGTHMRDILVRKPISVVINKEKLTVKELVTTIAYVIKHEAVIPKEIEDYELFFQHADGYSAGQVHYKAENGLALIKWLNGIAVQAGRVHNESWAVTTYNDKLMVVGDTGISAQEYTTAVSLDAVTSVTLTGPVIDIEAPYNPLVYPGVLIAITPRFFTSVLPNTHTPDYIGFENQLYKVITMEVKFSTRDANMMKIKAVGGTTSYRGARDSSTESNSTPSERMEAAQGTALARVNKEAVVTDSEAMAANAVNAAAIGTHAILESNTAIQIQFGVHVPVIKGELDVFLTTASAFANGGQDVAILDTSSTFASLAAEHYEGKVAYKEVSRTEQNPNKPPLSPVPDGSGSYINPSIPCEYFAPVIALATYAQYAAKGGEMSGYANVAECLTSSIPNGKAVVVPSLPDDITTMNTWSMAFDQYANLLLSDPNSGVSDADVSNYRQIAYYMESP